MQHQITRLLVGMALCFGSFNVAMAAVPPATFAASHSFPTGTAPDSVAVGDFNGDGKSDLAVPNNGDNTVSILLGNGNGTFAAKVDYIAGSNPTVVAVGDFNGDGKSDLAVANASSSNVSILLGNGNGTFAAKVDYISGTGPSAPFGIIVRDFNGDGKLDLAVANLNASSLSILLGNGDGTFATNVDYDTGLTPTIVAAGDFNGDGKSDLAVGHAFTDTVSILLGNGDGTFAAKVDYIVGPSPFSVAVGDFNGDGKSDLAVTNGSNASGNHVSILLGNGDGTFATKVDYNTGSGPFSVAVGDFNGDTKADLAVANSNATTVSILLGNGDGTFVDKADYGTGTSPYFVTVGDFNGDSKTDLAVANHDDNTVSILLRSTPGSGGGAFGLVSVFGLLSAVWLRRRKNFKLC